MTDQFSFDDNPETIRLRTAWDHVVRRLSDELPAAWIERFIKPLSPYSYNSCTVVLKAPGRFIQEWVRERYLRTIEAMLGDELGDEISVEIMVVQNERETIPAEQEFATVKSVSDTTKFQPIHRYSFDNFVVGQSNRLAFAGARAVAAEPGEKYNPLFIYGPSGLGKTHLLHAIAKSVLARDPRYSVAYITAQQFAEEFVGALQSQRIEQFRRSQRNFSLWLVDDIQFVAGKDKTQEEIFHTFNLLHSYGKQIVLTSDRPPRDLYLMDERLRSRFEAGLVADIQMPDTETRCAILLQKAKLEKVDIELDVAMHLAENVPGNIRILEGALTKLAVQASVSNCPITFELAREMVEQYYRAGTFAKPSFSQIVDTVGKHFKIPSIDIKGTSRKAPVVHARHIAVYITRELTKDSWKHIGTLFGDRDHTSMMHGYQKISEMIREDRDLGNAIKSLMRDLYPDA